MSGLGVLRNDGVVSVRRVDEDTPAACAGSALGRF